MPQHDLHQCALYLSPLFHFEYIQLKCNCADADNNISTTTTPITIIVSVLCIKLYALAPVIEREIIWCIISRSANYFRAWRNIIKFWEIILIWMGFAVIEPILPNAPACKFWFLCTITHFFFTIYMYRNIYYRFIYRCSMFIIFARIHEHWNSDR